MRRMISASSSNLGDPLYVPISLIAGFLSFNFSAARSATPGAAPNKKMRSGGQIRAFAAASARRVSVPVMRSTGEEERRRTAHTSPTPSGIFRAVFCSTFRNASFFFASTIISGFGVVTWNWPGMRKYPAIRSKASRAESVSTGTPRMSWRVTESSIPLAQGASAFGGNAYFVSLSSSSAGSTGCRVLRT